MTGSGIIRRIDDLGRIAIPKELRRHLNIKDGAALEMTLDGKNIILSKYEPMQVEANLPAISNALRHRKIDHAVYTTDNLIRGCKISENAPAFPKAVPEDWQQNAHRFSVIERGDIAVFPVLVNGEIYGYIATNNNNDNRTAVELAVDFLIESIREQF